MKNKRFILRALVSVLLILLFVVICLVFSDKILLSQGYHASTGYQIWIGDDISATEFFGATLGGFHTKPQTENNNDLRYETAREIATQDFTFSPAPELQARFHPGVILYGERLDEDGNLHSYWYVSAKIELSGKILESFPRGTRYAPIDDQEFCDLLTKELQSRLGPDAAFTVVDPDASDTSAFWGEKHWQLKRLPER